MKLFKLTFLWAGLLVFNLFTEMNAQTTIGSTGWASGPNAGGKTTTGAGNAFFARAAGWLNTTGGQNSYFGTGAGAYGITGANNSFFGYEAGTANQGSWNSSFGSGSGTGSRENPMTGNYNSFFGGNSGQQNTSGSFNSFFGEGSGTKNTLGNGNTFMGHFSGHFNNEGNYNVFLGKEAGWKNQGSNNVFIGYQAGRNNVNDNNTLRIANQANQTLITGDFENMKVGIGVNEKNQLNSTLSFGTFNLPKRIGLWDNVHDWYGLGMDPYKMRLQVGNINASFGFFVGDSSEVMTIQGDGRVTIGNPAKVADTSKYLLQVKTGVLSEDFGMANVNNWADYVFEDDYQLRTLKEVEDFIKKNKHLPEVPSEATVKVEGYSLHDINITLLQKIEELTLYTIQQQKQLNIQQKQIEMLLKEKTNH